MTAAATITVRVPVTIRRRGERTLVVAPDGGPNWALPRARLDNTLIKALARAHRWQRMLDDGRYGSVSELAAAEKLDRGYLGRILMLMLLAPDIVEAIMNGRQPTELGVHVLRKGFPVEWGEQRTALLAPEIVGGPVRASGGDGGEISAGQELRSNRR
jgi:hypothetical protein